MYFKLEETVNLASIHIERPQGFLAFMLLSGKTLPQQTIKHNLEFKMSEGFDENLNLNDWYSSNHLMSHKMVSSIESAGADNIQKWPASIKLPSGLIKTNYFIVNIIGSYSCALDEKSESTPFADSKYFFNLIIDPNKVGNSKIFRVVESKLDILIDSNIASALKLANLNGVNFLPATVS
jgi:hypothetical protein